MTQIDLPLHRKSDPQTSRKAAERTGQFRARHEAKIYMVLGHLTYREIADLIDLEPVAVARRLRGMEVKRLIVRDGERDGMTLWRKV